MPFGLFGAIGAAAKIGGGLLGASKQAAAYNAAADSRERIAAYNLETAERNARLSHMLGEAGIEDTLAVQEQQAELMRLQADAEYFEAKIQRDLHRFNASRIRKYGRIESVLAYENIRRTAANFEKEKKTQRAAYAAAGVALDTGSPLQVAVETARNQQLALNDMFFQRRLARTQRREAAQIEQFMAGAGMIAAKNRRAIGYAEAELAVEDPTLSYLANDLQLDQSLVQANIRDMAAQSAIAGFRSRADAARIGGIGSAVSQGIGLAGQLTGLS